MRIAIATDHHGETMKKEIIKYLSNKEYEVKDYSPDSNVSSDYTDYAFKLAEAIRDDKADRGILLCGTGIGMSIAANKVQDIRCAHVSNVNEAVLTREHNNANIIALGTKMNLNEILKIIDVFLSTEFSNEERHARRVDKISKYEKGEYNV